MNKNNTKWADVKFSSNMNKSPSWPKKQRIRHSWSLVRLNRIRRKSDSFLLPSGLFCLQNSRISRARSGKISCLICGKDSLFSGSSLNLSKIINLEARVRLLVSWPQRSRDFPSNYIIFLKGFNFVVFKYKNMWWKSFGISKLHNGNFC